MRKRLAALFILSCFATGLTFGAASAQGVVETAIADALLEGRVWVEDGSGVDESELEELHRKISARGYQWGLVAVADEPTGGADRLGEDVLASIRMRNGAIDTVIVLALETVGGFSIEFNRDERTEALAAAVETFERDFVAGFAVVFEELTRGLDAAELEAERDAPAEPDDNTDDDAVGVDPDGGDEETTEAAEEDVTSEAASSRGTLWVAIAAAAVAAVFVAGALGVVSRRKKAQLGDTALDERRYEIRAQMNLVAARLADLDHRSGQLSESASTGAAEAAALYREVRVGVTGASSLTELDELGQSLTRAGQKIEQAETELAR